MTYQIRAHFQVIALTDRDLATLAKAALLAFRWDVIEARTGESLSGHCNTDEALLDEEGLTLFIDRELGDDIDVIRDKEFAVEWTLEKSLEHQFFLEIAGDIEDRLRTRGLMLMSARPTVDRLENKAQRAFIDASEKWEARKQQRQERADLLAYARVLARRGLAPGADWPVECQEMYDSAMRKRLAETLEKIQARLAKSPGSDGWSLNNIATDLQAAATVASRAVCKRK